jgi:hypothetical protein
MTNDNAATANHETCAVIKKDLSDVQLEAVLLHGLIEGIAHLDNDDVGNARAATIDIALRFADQLSIRINDLGERKL